MTSGVPTATSTATFDNVNINTTASLPPTLCPTGWSCNDIGYPTPAGEQTFNAGSWTIRGGGSDIWNTNDEFRYVSQTFSGDGSISAHVASQQNVDPYSKAGVMIRQSADPGSVNYAVLVTPGNGILVQYRATALANAAIAASITGVAPQYLKVGVVGNTFTAYTSPDGTNWTAIPGSSINITDDRNPSGRPLLSHRTTVHNWLPQYSDTVTISSNSVYTYPTNWNCADVGAPALAGSQTVSGNTWTMQAAGGDIGVLEINSIISGKD